MAYFSEKDFYSVDMYLADGVTGKVKRRILKSGISSNYETYRFINSQANWSPDGKFLAFAAKRGPRDDILIVDVDRNKEVKRIKLKLSGVTTPSWSPDGKQLVFTGYEGGLSDLYVVNRDGSGLRQLTEDKYADLHPVWSPDGGSIAFATDRGPETDFRTLAFGNFRIALFDLATGSVRVLDRMEHGKNVSPQWSPDGQSLAFVSDRNGVSNVFLYDLEGTTSTSSPTSTPARRASRPLSPVISWASGADRLAFVYFEPDQYDVYSITNPALAQAAAVPGHGAGQRRDSGARGDAAARHRALAPGDGGSASPGRRGRIHLPDAVGLPLLERGGPVGRHHPSGRAGLHRGAARLGRTSACPTPASSRSSSTAPSSRRTTWPGPPSATPATTSAGASSAGRRSR